MTADLTMRLPDDWHVHLRDGAVMKAVLPDTAAHFGRALVMPNLVPPVVTMQDAIDYRERIMACMPAGSAFNPLMTLYLTETSSADDVAAAYKAGVITAVKLYPAGATTNSDSGVRDINKVAPGLARMAEIGLPLCVHGEVTDPSIDIFDREAVFIETVLDPMRRRTPGLKVIMEHVTTEDGVQYVQSEKEDLAATITTHHLMINRNHIFQGGIRPHYFCLPIAKREHHRLALRAAAVSGDSRFFLGTDSAPHVDGAKESACGCAGVYNAPNTLACLAHVFEEENSLDKLESFVSLNGAAFYGVEPGERTITLKKQSSPATPPAKLKTADGDITVFDPMCDLHWCVV